MTVRFTARFTREYRKLPEELKDRVDRALHMLQENPRHPGLNVKKMKGFRNIWEARVSHHHRITFQIKRDIIYLRRVGPHDVEEKP